MISFEAGKYKSSNFVLSQDCFHSSGSLEYLCEFQGRLTASAKKSADILTDCVDSADKYVENGYLFILGCQSKIPSTGCFGSMVIFILIF